MEGKLVKWSCWCPEHNATVYSDFVPEEAGPITKCPKNETHTNISQVAIAAVDDHSVIPVRQIDVADLDPNYARTRVVGVNFDAAQGQWTKKDVSFPYTVNILNGEGYAGFVEEGDKCEFRVAPILVGAVVAPAAQGAEEVAVDPSMAPLFAGKAIFPGMLFKFKRSGVPGYPDNPDPGADEYEVVSFSAATNTVTLRKGLESDVPAGSLVYLLVKYGDDIELQQGEYVNVGGSAAGSAPLPAGTVFEVWFYAMTVKRVRLRLNLKYGPIAE